MLRRLSLPDFPPDSLLVGGAARDLLRGATPKDFDWMARDPQVAANAWALRTAGSAFALDEERCYWRVSASGEQHDFVPMPADILADLGRRDFTVNAMAIRQDGVVTDPHGGRRDLRRRQLRMVSRENLRADPLRLLRAVRLSVSLGFALERSTHEAVGQLAREGLPRPAAERVRDELASLLLAPDAARGVLLLAELNLLEQYLPELAEGYGVEQQGFHHLDVFHHNVEALHQLITRFPQPGQDGSDLALRWATLLHDVGKPRTATPDPERGYTRFYGHDRVGAELTRMMLARLRLPASQVDRATQLVKAHMVPLPGSEREARRFVHRRRELLPDLLKLMLADREAGRGPMSNERTRHAYKAAMSLVLEAMEERPQPLPPLLRGTEVMELLNIPAGPQVGEALRAVSEAQALGDIQSPEQARTFLLGWVKSRPGED
ncbi:HD domain-containing protein [Deinococcus peraridilitoris]|uniref:Putative domain HDIG-containing protein n=1 Tax=Deinococcus peraridilitoris (strain DSM 19664 / LMG 22246 / CIP 109416 / KR-200) TaxID=937777 RepID=K9ZVL2_DEIPD|nr:HD domain-containing protein [Deinococcus peraridilitoris]AFZ65633.1 putative domain HDIG-containing protein [Deinococcus peraridilitoris DSM 19664]